tara:strand:- start:744 stop:884 length:141 start_codon:yes stop_codon:yes gene_type:complete
MILKKCDACKKYTLKEKCSKCHKKTKDAPYKFQKLRNAPSRSISKR